MSSAASRSVFEVHSDSSASTSGWLQRRPLFLTLLLVIITIALYYPVKDHAFLLLDDSGYVTDNPHVRSGLGWDTIKWAFTTNAEANWHPLTWLSHALDFQLFLLDAAGHHLMNVGLHAVNVALLFWVLLRATGYAGRSFMVAALFAVHPLNVESVAWVAERKNLLSMMFFLLALAAYRWYARQPSPGRYGSVALLYGLGLMAKPQVITLPCVLLLWDYWPLRRMFADEAASPAGTRTVETAPGRKLSWLLLEKLPLFVLCALSAMITFHTQHSKGATSTYSFATLAKNAVVSYPRYLAKAVWPSHLAIFYPYPRSGVSMRQVIASSILLLTITAVVFAARHRRYLLVGWLWFLGTLVPMIGLVQVGAQSMADRYAYLPFIGLFIMAVWGVADWAVPKRLPAIALPALGLAILVALAAVTHRQLGYWSDNLPLWSHALEVTSGNYTAEDMVGAALLDKGEIPAAMRHFQAAAAIYPREPLTYYYMGVCEEQQGNLQAAITQYQRVIALTRTPELRAAVFTRLGNAYRALGDEARAQKSFAAAAGLQH